MPEKFEVTADQLKGLIAEATKSVAESFDAKLEAKTAEFNTIEQKFAKIGQVEDISKLAGKEKMAMFVKALYNKDNQALAPFKKAMSEGSTSGGGFLVPEEFTAEVYRIIEDFGLISKLGTRIVMGSDTKNVPRLSSSVTISYPGEATAGTESQPVLAQVQLLAKTCIGLTAMSNELLADANVSVVDLLAQLFAEAIAGEIDSQGFTGTGSPFTGILGDTGCTVVTMGAGQTAFSDVTLGDFRDMITQVKPWALQGAGFVMHRTVWALAQKARVGGTASTTTDYFASSANPVIIGVPQGYPSATAGFLWGYPVYLSDKMPSTTASAPATKFALFGNLKHVFYGVREELAVSISDSATVGVNNLFEQNMSAVRVIARHAIAVGLPSAFAVLKTHA